MQSKNELKSQNPPFQSHPDNHSSGSLNDDKIDLTEQFQHFENLATSTPAQGKSTAYNFPYEQQSFLYLIRTMIQEQMSQFVMNYQYPSVYQQPQFNQPMF